jgi:hypothetical protein
MRRIVFLLLIAVVLTRAPVLALDRHIHAGVADLAIMATFLNKNLYSFFARKEIRTPAVTGPGRKPGRCFRVNCVRGDGKKHALSAAAWWKPWVMPTFPISHEVSD